MIVPFARFKIAVLPKMNTSATRRHWTVAHRARRDWQRMVNLSLTRRPAHPFERALVIATRWSVARKCPDEENLAMSFKPIFDALVEAKVLVDDDREHCTRRYDWKRCEHRDQQCIEIEIAEIQ